MNAAPADLRRFKPRAAGAAAVLGYTLAEGGGLPTERDG